MSNMTLKDKIKNGLSYTSLTYEEMLQDMLGLFIGENAITTRWNNLSETDIITILMSIFAAHRDMQNYMIDYRTLENYMTTAKEFSSIVRIAKSHGYKIPLHKASRIRLKLPEIDIDETDEARSTYSVVQLENGTIINDIVGIPWLYEGPSKYLVPSNISFDSGTGQITNVKYKEWLESKGIQNLLNIDVIKEAEFIQGIRKRVTLLSKGFNNQSLSHILTSNSIAGGTTTLSTSVSGGGQITLREINNFYTARQEIPQNSYMIDIDTEGLLYIKLYPFQNAIDVLSDTQQVEFSFIETTGIYDEFTAFEISNKEANPTMYVGVDPITVSGEEVIYKAFGSAPLNVADIKEDYKYFSVSKENLIVIDDVKNHILRRQLIIPSSYMSDVLVADVGGDTADKGRNHIILENGIIDTGEIEIYILSRANTITLNQVQELKEEIQGLAVSGNLYTIVLYNSDYTGSKKKDITVTFASSISDESKSDVLSYMNQVTGIGDIITDNELRDLIYSQFRYTPTQVSFTLTGLKYDEFYKFV